MIEHGDPRLPASFWEKVIIHEGEECWEWTGANQRGDRNCAIIHYAKGKVTTLRMYYAMTFYAIKKVEQKTRLTCDNPACANPNHTKVIPKGECVHGHVAKKYANGQCSECRRLKDAAIPREVIAERARVYRANLKASGAERTALAAERKRKREAEARRKERAKREGLSLFNDTPLNKPWRPTGWSEEVLDGKLKVG